MIVQILANVKLIKGIPVEDTLQDDLLKVLIDESADRILGYINVRRETAIVDFPVPLLYVLQDVTVKRFNRLNSEGAVSDSEEGRSYTWSESYLDEHLLILDSYHQLPADTDLSSQGNVWWY